ncbi:radical SAM protein [Embleya sp. NPDC005575]|uniref:radical SAM protein n=1 Tax=Embleya sp. NPDC005575 TaxID=3156892 RepID=UPI0033A1690B
MHKLIASRFLDRFLVLRPGQTHGMAVSEPRFDELQVAASEGAMAPSWLIEAARKSWAVEIGSAPLHETVLVRERSRFGFSRGSYELNLGCNYDCPFCYLGVKKFEGLDAEQRVRLLHIMRDAGVVWLQLTGGEPMIDPGFLDVYGLAYRLGMMITISTNGSRLWKPEILAAFAQMPPYRITVSVYGATAETYDETTRRRGSFKAFIRGLTAAHEAGLRLRLNIVVAKSNEHEVSEMEALADSFNAPHHTFTNMSPTIYGGPETLPAQSERFRRQRKPFTGCNAGHTFFHADPFGIASICKVGRDPSVNLMEEGLEGLSRLGPIADSLMLRTGGCSGCQISGSCFTCRPLAKLYQEAKAPLHSYCQYGGR